MRTITEVSNELGVSRKKIYNEIVKLKIETNKDGKNNFISDNDFERIKERVTERNKEHIGNAKERTKNVLERDRNMIEGHISDREYVNLKERIEFLEQQINIKDEQIQAKDLQINGLIQSTFNFSKVLQIENSEVASTKEPEEKKSWISKLFRK